MTRATADRAVTYPHGVPCWIDLATPDVSVARDFYGPLLGWTFETITPVGVPPYVVARLDGMDAAALATEEIGHPDPADGGGRAHWRTYISVDDLDATIDRAIDLGGPVPQPATTLGAAGRTGTVGDPDGNRVHLWQAGSRLGAQVTNEPGAWRFTNLRIADEEVSHPFYAQLLGWSFSHAGYATAATVAGYGAHLAALGEASATSGLEDVVGFVASGGPSDPLGWHVVLAVADHEATAARAEELGGELVARFETDWTSESVVRDPQGATLTLGRFTPPG